MTMPESLTTRSRRFARILLPLVMFGLLVSLALPLASCQTTEKQKLVDPSTIDTSTTSGLIRKLQALNPSPTQNENLRYISFLLADYGASMTSQTVGRMLERDDLTIDQKIWLQEIRIDMGRALVGCASNPSPSANIFQQLFIFKIAYLIAKRDAPAMIGSDASVLVDTLQGIQNLTWEKVTEGVKAPLDPLDHDVKLWMDTYGKDTHRFWWPREVGLLMSLDSVDNLQFTGMLASVERANEGIGQLNKTLESSQFIVERLPMLASWEFQLAMTKLMGTTFVQGIVQTTERISQRMMKLEQVVGTSFESLARQLGDFNKGFSSDVAVFTKGVNDLTSVLTESRDRLSTALEVFGQRVESEGSEVTRQLSVTSNEIGSTSSALASTLGKLDRTIVDQERNLEKIADEIRNELDGQADAILDRATYRIGMAVGLGVLCSLLVVGLVGVVALRIGLLGGRHSG